MDKEEIKNIDIKIEELNETEKIKKIEEKKLEDKIIENVTKIHEKRKEVNEEKKGTKQILNFLFGNSKLKEAEKEISNLSKEINEAKAKKWEVSFEISKLENEKKQLYNKKINLKTNLEEKEKSETEVKRSIDVQQKDR